ncbi:MAG: MBL fold metallo-hydrolase [Spirochaetaceae bacterium]|jgi:glyoxylase-like metal-dependent hydrolase (beta-lactamase superfamily II)|nr:MBL fold metallo-hydrolase [Spirochaetaceae bacterium]
MKIYYHINMESFANCYLVVNEDTREALIIDPCKITPALLNQIEDDRYNLTAVLITHSHPGHHRGLRTLKKIYTPRVYAAEYDLAGSSATILKDSGTITEAGFTVHYSSLPGHSADSICYRIAHVIFTGDVLTAGITGTTDSNYAKHALAQNVRAKLFSRPGFEIIMPGHGPPSSVEAEQRFNIELSL